jgi:23S rRNA (cytosine1962-C5)-methyltransferase
MENDIKIWASEMDGYKLLDSGLKQKLEEICGIRIIRSEPKALWKRSLKEEEWQKANAFFDKENQKEWRFKKSLEIKKEVILDLKELELKTKISFGGKSKHIGIFPEQFSEWKWIRDRVTRYEVRGTDKKLKVLNLFGYTGIASLVAGSAGAEVTHVDASKQSVEWAKENQKLSGLENAPIRWIVDDVLKFLKREISRGVKYDAIIMDPPSYGKGPKGEVWKVESSLTQLLDLCKKLLSNDSQFIILNMYSIELSSISLKNLLGDITKDLGGEIINGELTLKEEVGERLIPLSLFAIWDKN